MHIQDEWQTRLIGAREAARRLGLSIWTVYALARSGRLPSVRLGKRRLFLLEDLEQLIATSRKSGPTTAAESRKRRMYRDD